MKPVSDALLRCAARLLAVLALACLAAPALAQTIATLPNFAQRYSVNASGDIRIIGNTILTCVTACPTVQDGTGASLNNNNNNQRNLDVDTSDAGLNGYNNSSSAEFTLPAGATILQAYLYWFGEINAGASTARGQVKLRTAAGGSYTTVTASNIHQQAAGTTAGTGYVSVADVTSLVSQASTTFTVAGVVTQSGPTNASVADTYAGWSLVLVLADPAEPFRKLTVFDGLKSVGNGAPQTINLSLGANATPPTGPVSMRMGVIAGEGDLGTSGDAMSVRSYAPSAASTPNAYTLMPNAAGATNNFFNSSISRLNSNIAAKNPNYINNLGVDMDTFDVPNTNNAVVQSNSAALDINLTSTGDVYLPMVVTTAVQLYVPNVQQDMVKTVVDLNGGDVAPGDILEYTIAFSNTGGDYADAMVLNDPIPTYTTYVPGSLSTATGPVLSDVARSDASGDDQAEYFPTGCPSFNSAPCVRARLGVGATSSAGGTVEPGGPTAPGSQARFRFRVQVNSNIPQGTIVNNSASVTYTARTLAQTFTVSSPVAAATNGPSNLRLTKTHTGDFQQGQSNAAYTLTVINDGGVTTAPFTVTDTLPSGLTFVSGSGTHWTCSAIGQVVSCENNNNAPLSLSASSSLTLLVNVSPTASSPLVNTATVSGGGEDSATTGNNSASDSTTVVGAPNLTIAKVANATPWTTGQTGRTYTVTVTNSGTLPTSGTVTVVDTPPAGMTITAIAGTGWTCNLGTLTCTRSDALGAAQSYAAITVTVTAPATAGIVDNVVTVSGGGELYTADNTATQPTTITTTARDLTIVKSHTGNFHQGQTGATYTLTVTNVGGSVPSGQTTTVTDTPPAGMTITAINGTGWTCTQPAGPCTRTSALAAAASFEPLTVTVNVATNAGTPLVNQATVAVTGEAAGEQGNNTDSDSTIIAPRVDLAVTKATTNATPVQGAPFAYTVTVTNSSINSATGVSVLDLLPAGISLLSATPSQGSYSSSNGLWTVGTLAASGGSATLTLNVTATTAGAIVNTAQVQAADQGDLDSTPGNSAAGEDDQASVTVTVSPAAQLVVSKTTSTATIVNSTAGTQAAYTLTVSNTSSTQAADVVVTDTLPAGFSYASHSAPVLSGGATRASVADPTVGATAPAWGSFTIPASGSVAISFVANVAAGVANGTYNNSASATMSTGGSVTQFDGTASSADNVTVTSAVLAVSKSTSTPSVAMGGAGATATYTLTVANAGNSAATGVKVTDQLPAGFTYSSTTSVTLNGSALGAGAYQVVTSGAQTSATPQWDTNPAGGFTINAGQSLVIVFDAAVSPAVTAGVYNNSASATGVAAGITNFDGGAASSDDVTVSSGVAVSGWVYADANHNANREGSETGALVTLYAKLVPVGSPSGPATLVATADASTGAYSFSGVSPGTYSIVLDDNANAADVTPTPPAGWIGTEAADGVRSQVVVASVELQSQNFGLFNGSRLTGRVFADNGAGGGIPNDGVQNGSEAGLAGVTVRRTIVAGTQPDETAQTNGTGDYTLWIPFDGANTTVRITQTNAGGYLSTGGAAGNTGGSYSRSSDWVSLVHASGSSYSGVNFADVRDNALANNGQQHGAPGAVVFYAHTFTPGSGGSVNFNLAAAASPATATGFSQVLLQDSNCNGLPDTGEPVLATGGPVAVQADVPLCLIVREQIPANAPAGATDAVTLTASFSHTNASPALSSSHTNTDITTVGAASALALRKSQSTATVLPGATITYTVDYSNLSADALANIRLRDATPAFTRFVSAACGAPLPSGITACTVTTQPTAGATGSIEWTLTGSLASAAKGTVSFTVQVAN